MFGPKLEHLDLIEYVVVDLLKVKWETFIKREFFKQMIQFSIFFALAITAFIIRPLVPEPDCGQEASNMTALNSSLANLTMMMMNETNFTCEAVSKTSVYNCYLHEFEEPDQQIRLVCEILIVIFALLYLLKALREFSFLGRKVFLENMVLCPSRVCFLISCLLLQEC